MKVGIVRLGPSPNLHFLSSFDHHPHPQTFSIVPILIKGWKPVHSICISQERYSNEIPRLVICLKFPIFRTFWYLVEMAPLTRVSQNFCFRHLTFGQGALKFRIIHFLKDCQNLQKYVCFLIWLNFDHNVG